MPLDAVFFDLDGTLLDTSLDLGCALNHILMNEGIAPLSQNKIRAHVSNGAAALIRLGLGQNIEEEHLQKHRSRLLDYYLDNIAEYTEPFQGIRELIEQCATHSIKWGIVTNKPKLYTEVLMGQIPFASEPSAIVCPDHIGISKPSPEPLLHACKLANCSPDNAIYIGDHLRDIECGKNANMTTIAVGYGFTESIDEHLSWGATHSVSHADEIWPILEQYRA